MRRVREAIEFCLEIEGEPEKSTQFIVMPKTPPIARPGIDCCAKKSIFDVIRTKGSHYFMGHPDGMPCLLI